MTYSAQLRVIAAAPTIPQIIVQQQALFQDSIEYTVKLYHVEKCLTGDANNMNRCCHDPRIQLYPVTYATTNPALDEKKLTFAHNTATVCIVSNLCITVVACKMVYSLFW